MTRFIQLHTSFDDATLNSLQRSYDDFCRDAGVRPKLPSEPLNQHAPEADHAQIRHPMDRGIAGSAVERSARRH